MSMRHGFCQATVQPVKTGKPIRRRDLVMPCPTEGCGDEDFLWHCVDCRGVLEYGILDGHFYCECGAFKSHVLLYTCCSHEFEPANAIKLENALDKLRPYEELNLLILGETGVGKSTFINAFANYLSYPTLEKASHNELITLIPNQFYLTNDKYEEVCIQNGDVTKEENFGAGQSATQATKIHRFVFGKTVIRLIDTPGVGDVRGALKDKENFKNILDTIGSLDVIHGIIILLKSNQARLTVTFRYCIEELLVHLHKSAVENMVFGFTNTRGTNFRPGDTMPPLKELIEMKSVGVQIVRENTYCFDSESYRFLASLRPEYRMKYDDELVRSFERSWMYSVKETERLVRYIKSLPPHKTKQTVSLNNARILILQLTKPMAEISRTIVRNLQKLSTDLNHIKSLDGHSSDLLKGLMIEKINLKAVPLDYPRTVCANKNCVQITKVDGYKRVNYVTVCHESCYLKGIKVETTNNQYIKDCKAMLNNKCINCGHSYTEHMHVTYEIVEKKVKVENKAIQHLIAQNASSGQIKAATIAELKRKIDEYKDELWTVETIAAKFGAFLKYNSITVYSDSWLEYLHFLTSEEEKKPEEYKDTRLLNALNKTRQFYEEQVSLIEKAIQNGEAESDEVKDPGTIERLVDHLCNLKNFGKSLEDIKEVAVHHSAKLLNENTHRQDTWATSEIARNLDDEVGQEVNDSPDPQCENANDEYFTHHNSTRTTQRQMRGTNARHPSENVHHERHKPQVYEKTTYFTKKSPAANKNFTQNQTEKTSPVHSTREEPKVKHVEHTGPPNHIRTGPPRGSHGNRTPELPVNAPVNEVNNDPCIKCQTFEHSRVNCPNYSTPAATHQSTTRHSLNVPSKSNQSHDIGSPTSRLYQESTSQKMDKKHPVKSVEPKIVEDLEEGIAKLSIRDREQQIKMMVNSTHKNLKHPCTTCGQLGHNFTECNSRITPKTCYKCRRIGHISTECPEESTSGFKSASLRKSGRGSLGSKSGPQEAIDREDLYSTPGLSRCESWEELSTSDLEIESNDSHDEDENLNNRAQPNAPKTGTMLSNLHPTKNQGTRGSSSPKPTREFEGGRNIPGAEGVSKNLNPNDAKVSSNPPTYSQVVRSKVPIDAQEAKNTSNLGKQVKYTRCGGRGHIVTQCPSKEPDSSFGFSLYPKLEDIQTSELSPEALKNIVCLKCHRFGHLYGQCQLSDAGAKYEEFADDANSSPEITKPNEARDRSASSDEGHQKRTEHVPTNKLAANLETEKIENMPREDLERLVFLLRAQQGQINENERPPKPVARVRTSSSTQSGGPEVASNWSSRGSSSNFGYKQPDQACCGRHDHFSNECPHMAEKQFWK